MKDETRGRVADLIKASATSGAGTLVGQLPSIGEALANAGLSGAGQILADGIVGAVAPWALGAVSGYKMNRLARNMNTVIDVFAENIDTINERLSALEAGTRQKFEEGYRDAFLDTVVEENQEGKVRSCTNALINLMAIDEPSDDLVYTFFRDLSSLSELDLRVLRLHASPSLTVPFSDDTLGRLLEETGISQSQYQTIREKLCRFGLLESKNDERRDKNLEAVQDAVLEVIKQSEAKKPKRIKHPRFVTVRKSDSYSITRLGRQYAQFVSPVGDGEEAKEG